MCIRDRLRRQELLLKDDAEFSLQALLRLVAERLERRGKKVVVRPTQRDDHKAIGGAEKQHDVLAGMVRTLASMFKFMTGLEINPKSRLFAWLLRHANFLNDVYRPRREGSTSHHARTGQMPKFKLALLFEKVH